MNILIVAATHKEVRLFITKYEFKSLESLFFSEINNHRVSILITGIGIPNTIFELTRLFETQAFDIAINTGIAGAFNKKLKIGEVVTVSKDCFADIGFEEDSKFVPFTSTTLIDKDKYPFKKGWLICNYQDKEPQYKEVTGITVNRVHGNEKTISQMNELYQPDVESMEGAAFSFCCMQYNINFLQLRSISNYVEKRDTSRWDIPLAIKNINVELERILTNL